MGKSKQTLDISSVLVGMAVGAGAVIAANIAGRNPERRLDQILVNRALDKVYQEAQQKGAIQLDGNQRFVVFSDHHKGALNGADDFIKSKPTYQTALDYYNKEGYTLVILGDAEELWEETPERVIHAYHDVLDQEALFHPDRLIRVYGNHDQDWKSEGMVKKYMDPIFPGIQYQEGVLLQYGEKGDGGGEIFMVHGYQGSLESDILAPVSRKALPFYGALQSLSGLGGTTPAQDVNLRAQNDNRMYRWASKKEKLILIAGHTHRPVWSSKTHLEKLTEELYTLMRLDKDHQPENYYELLEQKKREVEKKRREDPPGGDIIKTKPVYYNTGCCRFVDGDVTGIELDSQSLRLVKWEVNHYGSIERYELENNSLAEIFLTL